MRILLLSLLLLLPDTGSAQEVRQVPCRFLRLGGDDDSETVLAPSVKGAEVNCPLSTSSISAEIICSVVGSTINFHSRGDQKTAGIVTLPVTAKRALLVFVKTPSKGETGKPGALPWRILAIEDTPRNFPEGGAFIANFYNNDIRFVVGEHRGMLHPAGGHGYAMPLERDSFNMAPVVFEFLYNGQWRTVKENNLRFLPTIRYLIFAYVDPESGRPRISTVQDLEISETHDP